MPDFQVFTRRMVPLKKQPFVTIQKSGTISLNTSAHALLGAPDAVELLFDAASQIVGLRSVDDLAEHAYPVRDVGGKHEGPFVVSGVAFTKFYDIPTDVSRRWVAYLEDDILCVDLTTPGTEVTSNRAR